MAAEISTIQSLRAVDSWIDVINANINGGVRTAFKTSRLKFGGSNTDVVRAGTTTSLPLQFPEPSLVTTNSVIDFTQGGITASTENAHLAIQGGGFFLLMDPASIDPTTGMTVVNAAARFLVTRDGEFHTNANGLLVNANGYFLVHNAEVSNTSISYDLTVRFAGTSQIRAVYNNIDNPDTTTAPQRAQRLTDFINQTGSLDIAGITNLSVPNSVANIIPLQALKYSNFGSTVFDIDFKANANSGVGSNTSTQFIPNTVMATILGKSLEASNASMTQSVPELSLAQKLFSALTKIIQTHQTNTDAVINLIR